eukprot:COSAG05_NODE_853_length_6963_cov_5.582314_4_plen_81_part_00
MVHGRVVLRLSLSLYCIEHVVRQLLVSQLASQLTLPPFLPPSLPAPLPQCMSYHSPIPQLSYSTVGERIALNYQRAWRLP